MYHFLFKSNSSKYNFLLLTTYLKHFCISTQNVLDKQLIVICINYLFQNNAKSTFAYL